MKCAICSEEWEDHHDFEAVVPFGCQCDPIAWGLDGDEIPQVCNEFRSDKFDCIICAHPQGCHK